MNGDGLEVEDLMGLGGLGGHEGHCLGGFEDFGWSAASPPSSLHVQDLLGLS